MAGINGHRDRTLAPHSLHKGGFLFRGDVLAATEVSLHFRFLEMATLILKTNQEMTSVWGVNAVAILDSSANCGCVWSTKKLIMPAYCVAANCNNSQTTPGITMHELPRNRPAVRQKWIKFLQFKRAFLLCRIMPICVASTSVSAISQTP